MVRDLSHSAFVILLALSDRPRHGLGIVDEVEERTGGRIRLGPGTLYGTLKRLDELGYVVQVEESPDPEDDDPRRKYYRVTAEGQAVLAEEADRMRALMEMVAGKDVLGEGRA